MIKSLALAACSAALLAGCAGPDAVTSAEPSAERDTPSEREYPTGSNIPRKKNTKADSNIPMGLGVRVHSREDLERIQQGGNGVPTKSDGLGR